MNDRIQDLLTARSGVRVIGDVHGDLEALRAAFDEAETLNLLPLLVGDIVDRGPDSPGCMELVLSRPCFVLPGNHDAKFIHWMKGNPVQITGGLEVTVAQVEARPDGRAIGEAFSAMMGEQPLWLRLGRYVFAHAAVSPEMVYTPAPMLAKGKSRDRLRALALYGETDGTTNADGFPNRTYGWIDQIPMDITAVVGHDAFDEIMTRTGAKGGRAVQIDTGCGKGGKLSWIDIDIRDLAGEPAPSAAPDEPLLTLMIGPSGAGKSTWTAANADPESVISTDEIRRELFGCHRVQEGADKVFQVFRSRAQARLSAGKPVVLDATHLRRRDRFDSISLVPPGHPVRYVVVDRPLDEKLRDGGWRLESEHTKDGMGLIERHDQMFKSGLKDILAGDGLPNVRVLDARTPAPKAAAKGRGSR